MLIRNMVRKKPVVLVFAGNDPSGGAGLQADIETLASFGCHGAPVITTVTVQNTTDILKLAPLDAALVVEQAEAILADIQVSAIKIGMLGSVAIIRALGPLLQNCQDIPIILDPILATGGGTTVVDNAMLVALSELLSVATVLTPNSHEARRLAGATSLDTCGVKLSQSGSAFTLITGTHEDSSNVVNRLYTANGLLESFTWARLNASYHGSGCTLAASIAALLAKGLPPLAAISKAQEYTWNTLKAGLSIGRGQYLPDRFFGVNAG